jgi:hypothetical protein
MSSMLTNNWEQVQRAIATYSRQQAAIGDALRQYQRLLESPAMARIRATLDQQRAQRAELNALLERYRSPFLAAQEQLRRTRAIDAALRQQTEALEQMSKKMANMTSLAGPQLLQVPSLLDDVTVAWAARISRAVAEAHVQQMEQFCALAIRPPVFLRQRSSEILDAEHEDEFAEHAAAKSVVVAAKGTELITEASVAVLDAMERGEIGLSADITFTTPCNMPELLIAEAQSIIAGSPEQLDNPELHRESALFRVVQLGIAAVHGVIHANSLWSISGLDDKLFTYTDRSVAGLVALPQFWGSDSQALCEVVRTLYMILYEGAGSDSLRFLTNGLLTRPEAQVVWDVKQFRNYYCDHDPEHGSRDDIREKREKLADLCRRYIDAPLPKTHGHFAIIIVELLRGTVAFLRLVCDRLQSQGDEHQEA